MATFKRFEDIQAWKKARQATRRVYELTGESTFARDFGLRDQLRRAAVSVMANIAEGFGRWNSRDFARFLAIASGSLRELETHLVIVRRLGVVPGARVDEVLPHCDELAKMLFKMRQRVLTNGNRAEQVRNQTPSS